MSGPSAVSFSSANQAVTTASGFTLPGSYTVRLTLTKGAVVKSDDANIEVRYNQLPKVDVGPDRTVPVNGSITITGSATDDWLQASALTDDLTR